MGRQTTPSMPAGLSAFLAQLDDPLEFGAFVLDVVARDDVDLRDALVAVLASGEHPLWETHVLAALKVRGEGLEACRSLTAEVWARQKGREG